MSFKRRIPPSEKKMSINKPLASSAIPPFTPDQVQTLTFRYYVNPAAASDTVNFVRELPIIPNAISVSATQLLQIYKAVRISKIEMWCNYRPSVAIDGNTINMTFVERRTVRPIEYSATAQPALTGHFKKKFSVYEPLGLWYNTASGETNPEIRFQFSKGALLEITYSVILHDTESVTTLTSAGMSFVRVYSNQLDTNVLCVGKGHMTVINT
jgi:hypothetical protein